MQTNYDVEMHLDAKVPMSDGVDLSADIYLPKAQGKFPAVLMRTPYNNNMPQMIEKARMLANNGYVCVMQDIRGRWDSEMRSAHQTIYHSSEYPSHILLPILPRKDGAIINMEATSCA